MRCGVIGSASEHQGEWFDETMTFLATRYHELSKKQIADLRVLGERFAAPTVKPTSSAAAAAAAVPTTDDDAIAGELDAVNAA